MKYVLYMAAAVLLAACHHLPTDNRQARMEKLADRSCRAVGFRQQRFALADRIRFAQDTLLRTKSHSDSVRLQDRLKTLTAVKAKLLSRSLALADTIHAQLDSLMPFADKKAQKRFTASLDSMLAKRGCLEKN